MFLHERNDPLLPGHRPVVLGDDNFAAGAEGLDRFADVARPQIAVAHLRAPDGVEVVHVVRDVLGHIEHVKLRKIHQHFRGSLGAGHELKHDLHAIDEALVRGLVDGGGRRNQCHSSDRCLFAQTGIDVTPWARRQKSTELILRAPAHRGSRHHALAGHRSHKACGSQHLDFSGGHVSFADHALDAAIMVGVAVRIDHRADRLVRTVLIVKRQRSARRLGGEQRIDDDQRGVAFDDRHVGDIEAAHLIDALRHFEQAVDRVELRLPPQARIDAVGGLVLLQEIIRLHVPHRARSRARHQRVGRGGDEAAHGIIEILAIGERQRLGHVGIGP